MRRGMAFWLINPEGAVLLRRRPESGLLGGMIEVPSSDWLERAAPGLDAVRAQAPVKAAWRMLPGLVRHTFTHFHLELGLAAARIGAGGRRRAGSGPRGSGCRWTVCPSTRSPR